MPLQKPSMHGWMNNSKKRKDVYKRQLKYNTLIATLQFVERLCSAAISLSQEELQTLSWSDLMLGIQEQQYPELVQYLKERRLYINEPVNAEGEV